MQTVVHHDAELVLDSLARQASVARRAGAGTTGQASVKLSRTADQTRCSVHHSLYLVDVHFIVADVIKLTVVITKRVLCIRHPAVSAVVNVYFMGPGNSLKTGPPAFSGGPNATRQRWAELHSTRNASRSLRRSSQRPHTVAYVHCKRCEKCNSSNSYKTDRQMVRWILYVFGAWNVRSGLMLLV